ncbi:Na/Pi cotransporter family protein [Phaeobacter gallaeciensis]|uniref:Na/Pi cotransporter family protein n=2 Tax=Roseobacteraceae TaxID=2854170 RepID=A0A366X1W5_9RHOB|nr:MULTISPECIES: Na/Pi cotransporter family protein [Roseobacteraceae]MBT3141318.1 Na/Pi cotransporter family protein [Falsiruegeria litorea]MBT8166768.1 Na/Pi cotransporter family protein [Falsiruegeria litorea]RBW56189.1 Na/Pi cotransporter family protein [Phaeobacter gallaeciensis]
MAIVSFLISLAGATMLLLFAVRMVRTGIERSYGASFQRVMTGQSNLLQSSLAGLVMAVVLQSSAAVALLTSGFAASGMLGFGAGLAIVLGGDLGSALIIQILSFKLDWLVPLLLAVGGWLFVKTEQKKLRQMGRILMGIAFILISLRFLREAMDPIRDSAFLPALAEYLARDYITAFIVGAALAFVMHSSVAAILMCVTLVQIGAIPFAAGLSLVLGANMGSAFIPVWLTRGMDVAARRIPVANLVLRGTWAVFTLFAVNAALGAGLVGADYGGQMLVNAHLAFNASLLVLALPFCSALRGPFERLLPDVTPAVDADQMARPTSVLNPQDVGSPSQAIFSLKRELLRMTDLVEAMFRPTLKLYKTGEKDQIRAVQAVDHEVNECLSGVRAFVAALPVEELGKENAGIARDMMEYAVRLETAGDVVAKRLTVLAGDLRRTGKQFSKEGWSELQDMHETILANLRLASNVLISDDLESARLLNGEKTEVKRAERNSRKRHFRRLQAGQVQSFETSDIHLETLRAFRDFNSHIASVATPILYQNGQLLETRLIEDMPTPEPQD